MNRSLDELSPLTTAERMSLRVARWVNETPRAKAVAQRFNELVGSRWMKVVSADRIHLAGIEHMRALQPDRGVLLASNHRSLFDMYMVTTYLYRNVEWVRRMYFPVRSHFYYERPLGVVVNAAMSGLSMYPPIFRAPEKRDVTRVGLDWLATELGRQGTVVGIHPEGTRGKGEDPYELLPAEQSFGRVFLQSWPIVVPIFIHGMGNDLARECWSTFNGTGKPIVIVFGEPLDLSEFRGADPTRLRPQIEVGRRVLSKIAELAERERAFRATLPSR